MVVADPGVEPCNVGASEGDDVEGTPVESSSPSVGFEAVGGGPAVDGCSVGANVLEAGPESTGGGTLSEDVGVDVPDTGGVVGGIRPSNVGDRVG